MLHEFASTDLSDEELLQRRFHDRRLDQKGQAQLDPAMDVGRWALFGRSQPQRRQKHTATQSSDSISAAASECLRRQRSPTRYRSHDPERRRLVCNTRPSSQVNSNSRPSRSTRSITRPTPGAGPESLRDEKQIVCCPTSAVRIALALRRIADASITNEIVDVRYLCNADFARQGSWPTCANASRMRRSCPLVIC